MKTNHNISKQGCRKPLRLWPGIIIVILQWFFMFVLPKFTADETVAIAGIFIGMAGGLFVVIWWLFFSRASRIEKWGAVIIMILVFYVTSLFLDISIATGAQGMMYAIFAIPVLSVVFVAWAVITRRLPNKIRRWTMVGTIILGCGFWILLRNDGITGDFQPDFTWRWAKTAEDKLLATEKELKGPPGIASFPDKIAEWPGFRGPNRNGIVENLKISTDWEKTPPVELWRHPVGPGCSSFAIHGNVFFTQEQRGEYEAVSCYDLNNGDLIWMHKDKARFYDSHAGAGPRSTPTLKGGKVYTLGATGILNVLDATDGSLIWSVRAAEDNGMKPLPWGFTSSPVVIENVVIVALSGKLAAYDIHNGESLWFGPDGGNSYSSPHPLIIDGVLQILLMSKSGCISVDPKNGNQLWNYSWPVDDRILQPAFLKNGDLLFAAEYTALRRVSVSQGTNGWRAREIWTTDQAQFNFSDFVIHKGHLYGFDGPRMACISLADGTRQWKGDRYQGWALLLSEQDLLVVLTEKGELALTEAKPIAFNELAIMDGISGRTWNHPAIKNNVLLVRNAKEMAAFRLPLLRD